MKHKTNNIFLYIAITLLSISSALAQEICTNGTDDDGDGFIDCYDGDCAGGPSCADFFYGNPIVCRDEPTANPTFQMKLQWGSEDRSADSHATPAVGDLDNDGLPEVVVINRLDERLFILNGEDGTTAFTYDLGYQPENGIVLANLDGGDCANIYVSRDNSSTITALDCEANFLWQSNASDRVGIMGIADFNGDGNAELYYKTEIMDAATGNIIVTGTPDNWVQNYAHSAIAVDILDDSFCPDCSGLELITGNQIWAINIATGTRTLAKDLNLLFATEIPVNTKRYYTKYFNTNQNRTAISVADYNQDGHVDVLMPGAYGSSNSSQTTIFFWDVFNDSYLVFDGGVNHNKGTGRLNVSDIDGDGLMNTTYVSDQILYALDENLNVLWTKGIDEGSSGFTGTTVFDFDGDGAAETIYRSESYLYIIDGTDGSTRTTVACKSRTQEEYPLVADVDNDGSSELCVPCYTSNSTPFSPYSNTKFSQIRIYEADGGEIWQPSRRVWNQHGYYNVNVNDDLTIPAEQQDHTAIFGTVNCDTGLPEDNRALNGFLNQSTFLEADGCPSYVSPDLNMAGNVVANPSLCPLTTFDVSFDIENTGDTDIFGTLPVTFYNGDPETPGAIKLNTETVVINNFLQGEIRTINMTVEGSGGDFDLYISINNNGQDPPITPGSGGFPECDFTNNTANVPVTYTPFTLTVNKLEENRRCDTSKPNNGEAEAYFEGTLGGGYETFWVEDFTGLPNGDRSDAGATAWTSTKGSFNPIYWGVNTKDGNKVYRTRKTGQNNEVSEVTWLSEVIDISNHTDVDISLDMLTNNTLEASGGGRDYMRAFYIVDGGAETEFDVNGELYGSFLYAVAEQEDLNGSALQIKVTFHTTGNGEYQYLDNVQVSGTTVPVVQQFTDADGFEFDWYNAGDFSAPVANGSLYTGMATGSYDVVGYFPGGNCYSDTVNIVINDSVPTFNVHVYEVAPYTDCADPDGALSAFVYTQTDGSGDPADTLTAGYSFSWVLSTEGITPVGTGPDLTNISSESYTVRVEQLITGCTSSASGAPSSSLIIPADPTPVPVDIVACSGPGSTGSATVSVGGVTAGYTFEWFYENVDATPDYTGSSIIGLLEGTYYVKAIDNGSSCESGLVTMQIQDLSGEPTPSAASVDNTSCTAFTGQVSADGDGAGTTAGYNFTWYAGKNDDPNNELPAAIPGSTASADGSTISNLPGGYYTVVVEQGGCVGSDTVFVDETFVIPQFTFNTPIDTEESIVLSNNGYVELPQLFGPGNEITNAVTISYWANLSVDNYNNDERIFSSGSTGENQVLLWSDNHNGLAFVVRTSSGGRGRINSGYSATGWAQIVGTWDGTTGEMNMYVNGVLIGSDNHIGSGILIDTGNPMYLGRDGNIGSKKFEGELDEVRIYNKALTVEEVNAQLCTELTGTEDGLVAYYDFNNIASLNTGTTIPDLAPQDGNNNGTIRNGGAANVSYPTATITCPNSGFNNNRSCDAGNPNGEVDLSDKITPAPGGGITYDFEIYSGFSTSGAPLDANTTGIFTGLPGGFYTVLATDQATGCATLEGRVSLNDIPDNPSIVTSITDDIGCSTIGLGEIAVTSSSSSTEPGGGYTYEIFDGFNFTTEIGSDIVVPDGSVGHTYTGLTDGPYRIRVTNNTLTCTSYVDVNVGDNPTNPSWNHPSTIINDNTTCAGTPNGFVSVAVTGGNTDYTFEWYNGAIVDPGQLIAGENDEFIDELTGGQQYTVMATSTITGCSTPAKTVTVNNAPVYPNVVVVEVQPQHSCDVGDGILRAYVDEPDPSDCVECNEADDYSFQWFLGNDTSTPLIEATDPGNNSNPTYVDSSRVEGLTGGDEYTVQVTNNLTGCTNEATITLTYDPQPPVIDAANSKVTANTLCGPVGNGSVVAAVNFVGETINGAVNDQTWDIITDCNTVTDLDSQILPDGSIELTPDQGNRAGKAYLGDSVDFSTPTRIDFWMYLGDKDVGGADGITFIFHQDPLGRDALGRYGCNLGIGDEPCFGGTETAISPSVAVEFDTYRNPNAYMKEPTYDHTNFVINGDMSDPQGDVGVFYNANQPRIVNGQDDVENADTELRVTITIVPNFDGTQTFSVYVEDELRLQRTQDFINDLFSGNPKTIGGFTASTGGSKNQQYVRLDPYFGEYDFDWYTGTGVNPANEIAGADKPFLCDLLGGDYTLVVTYGGSGCTSSPPVTFTIPNNTDTATVSFSGVSNTVCDTTLAQGGSYTGSLTANIAEDPTDYVFAWFEGTAPSADTLATTQSITNIPGGDYTVVVESLAGGCVAVKDTTLVDVTVDPAIVDVNADVTINNVTVCEGSATYPNGSITVDAVNVGTGPFGYWYYYGSDTTSGTFLNDGSDIFTQTGTPGTASVNVNGNGTATLTGLSAGDYTIIVVDSASGCTSIEANVNIIDDPTIPNLDQNVTPNTVCDPALAASGVYDGEVEITTTDGTDAVADYTYLWYDGTGTGTPTAYTVTDNILSEAPDGNYTVVATNTTTGCDTTIYAAIGDATVDPTIDNVTTQNVTACEGGPAYPNGSITIAAVTGTGPYDYLYYFGTDAATGTLLTDGTDIFTQTGTPGVASVNVSGNGTTTVTGLSAGDYTIVVIDQASGCSSLEANVQLIDVPTTPELNQNVTPNTICDPVLAASGNYDGEVEIITTDATNVTDYSYVWYDGTGTATPTVYTATNNILSEAPDGNYTVVATSNLTGCDTTIYATIGDATTIPTIDNVTTQNVTVCEGGPTYPNGSITVAAVTGTGPFDYLYYYGTDAATGTLLSDGTDIFTQTGTPGVASVNVNGNGTTTITGLSAGDYTIVLVDQATGCTSIEFNVALVNIPTTPELDQNVTPNTICDPLLATSGDYDGEVEIITTDATNVTDYSYIWYDGTGTATPTAYTATNNILSEAPDGNYTVVATSNLTGCDTTIYATIGDATTIPTIDNVTTQNVTVCEGGPTYPNGSITVAAVTGTGPFDYLYYYGTDAATGTLLSDGTDIFTQTGTPGAASVNVNGNGTATITGLSAGDYTIVLVDQATGCTSIESNVALSNIPTTPDLDQNVTPNTVCDITINNSGNYDGEVEIITLDATNEVTDYSYTWYDGTGTGTPTVYTATNNVLSEAPDGNYTVVATSLITGCDTTIYATIGDATVDPVLGTFNITDMTVCDGAAVYPNGAIEVDEPSITNGSGDYSYEFYWGPSIDAAKLLSDGDNITFEKTGFANGQNVDITGNIISNLDTGFYTIVVIDNVSGCKSGEQTVEIEDVLIDINVPAPVINHFTNCDDPDGSITVSPSMASGPEPALGYSYQWYFGSGTGNTLDPTDLNDGTELAGTTTAAVSGLEDGTYTVLITNNDTGCDTEEEYDIQDQRVYPVVDPGLIATTPNINCSGAPTGTIDPTGAVSEPGPYVFTLYDAADVVITTEDTGGGDDGIFDGLAAANYKIGVELANGCTSVATASVTVSDNFTYPNLTVTKLSEETSCIAPNGQIRVNDPGTSPAAGFDIIVYNGIGTGGAIQETIGNNYTGAFPISGTANMATGTYTVQMLNNDTGCESLVQVTINNVPDRPALVGGNVTRTNDTYCTSDNGSITVSTVTNPGVDPIFNLYSGSSIVPANLITSAQHPATNHTFSGLAAGTYTVSVIKDESGCESNGITRTVNFVPVSFTPGVSVFSDQSSCLISDPNGELIASIAAAGTGPSTNPLDYNFEWYQGQNTNPGNRILTGGIIPTAVLSSTNDSRVSGLPSGTYRLKVIEPLSGCFYVIDETIDVITTTPTIPGGGIIITDADQCAPSNGEINVTVNDGGSTQPYDGAGGYTFELYLGTIGAGEMPIQTFNQTAVFGAPNYQATHTFTDLQPDDYTIRIIDNNTSCLVTSSLQTVSFIGTTLSFDVNNMANIPLTGCFGNDGTLDIGTSLTIPGNTDDVTITWFVGSDTSNTANLIANAVGPPPAVFNDITNYNGLGYDIINGVVSVLPAVSYTGVAELSNGCKFLLEVDLSIIDAPDLLTAVTTPVSRCAPTYDGEVTLTVTPNMGNNAGQYNYYLYPGSYTVTDVTAGAPWDPAASSYNGGVTAGNDGDGDGTGTFTDNGANNSDVVTISELDSGTYTVIIEINTGSGCVTNVETITIDPPTEPNVTFDSKTDNTVCDVSGALDYNGSITVDAEHPDFAGSTFTFEWYYDNDGDGDFSVGQTAVANGADGAGVGSFVTGATTTNALTATLDGIGPGWYRVIATHTDANNAGVNATACPDTLDIEIFDDFVELAILPAAITTQTNVLDCAGGPEEFGEFELATVREDGADLSATTAGGNFTITWEYDNGGGFAAYAPNVDQNHSDDLAAGDYRITAVSTTTGCEVSYDFTIDDVTEDPVINMLNLSDNTICVGGPIGTIEADGQIIIEIQDELGAVVDPVDYDVEWFLNSIAGGNEIPASQVTGADITTTAVDVTLDDLPGGTYWVRVTKNNGDDEQCETTASFELIDDQAEVTIQKILNTDYTTDHNTDCSPDENGRVTLLNVYEDGVADPVANGNYVFNWFDADQVTPISVGTVNAMGDDVTDLPAGTYYVEAENINTDCVSDKVSFTINDNRVIPNLQLTQTLPDTTCVGSLVPSGEVTASVILPGGGAGNPADYTFTWYEGPGTGTPITVGAVDGAAVNGEMYEQLPAGIYTVVVEDNVTPGDNCTAIAQITVSRFTPIISIQTVDITIQNDLECNIDNGSATVDRVTVTKYGGGTYKVNSGDAAFADFDFNWYFTASGGVSQDNDNVFDLRPAGTYYVSVSNTQTMCAMPAGGRKAVTIQDVTTLPNVQLVTKTPDEYCTTVANEGDGTLDIEIIHEGNNPANPADYNITWYRGTGTGTTLASAPGSSAIAGGGTQLTGLSTGTYTVVVAKNGSPNDGCSTQKTFTIVRDAPTYALPESAMTIQDNQNCLNPNGTITINGIHIDGVFEDFSTTGDTYTIVWTGLPGTAVLNTVNFANDEVTALEAGLYEVDITNDRTNCTVNATIELDDIGANPVVQLVTKNPDEYCATVTPNEGDGDLTIKVVHEGNDPANPLDYAITWYRGTGTGTTLASAMGSASVSADGTTLTGLSTGTYTVTVSKNGTPNDGCLTQQTFTINRDAPVYSLPESAMTIQDNENCLNPNGTITINGVHIDGVFEDFSTTGDTYTIVWTGLPGTAVLNTVNFADDEVTVLEAGLYEVDITNDRTGCTVNATIELDDIGTTPVVQLLSKNPDEYCATLVPNEGDGDLAIKVVHEGNNPANPADYVITWYRGTGTGTTLLSAMGTASISADGTTLTGLSTGNYTVTVSKNGTPNDGCLVQQTFTINRDPQTYSLPAAAITKTNNFNCSTPNGTITIDGVFIDGVFDDFSATADTYTLNWAGLPGGAVLNTVNFADDQVTTIPGGTYTVDVTNERTNCTVTANITISNVTSNPVVQLLAKTPDEYCTTVTPNEGDGTLNIKLVHEGNNPADSTLYNIEWFRGTGTGTSLSGGALGSATISPNGTGLTGLSTGTYTVRVTDANTPNLGCVTIQTFTINRDAPTYSLPLSVMTIQDNLNCDNPNGSITINGVNIDGVFEDFGTTGDTYTINWTGLPGTAVLNTVNFANDQVTGIEGGTYTVDVENDRTGCTVSADIVIDDVTSNPLVQLVIKQPDEFCDNTGFQGNGSLQMRIVHEGNNPANATDYDITWYRGSSATGGNELFIPANQGTAMTAGSGTQLSGLSTDTYTVTVMKNSAPNDQCLTTTTFSINKDIPPFTIQTSSLSIADNTNCTNPNGSIQITNVVLDGVVQDLATFGADYAFTWPDGYNGGTPGSINSPNDIATGLPAGDYKIIGENVVTGCSTDTIIVTIIDDQVDPLLTFNVDQVNTNCGPTKNGQLTVTATTADSNPNTGVGRYSFIWYDGEGTAIPTSYVQSDGVGANDNQSTLLALDSGYYTVEVFDNINECTTIGTYAVSETLVTPKVLLNEIVVRADSTCDVGSSGTIIVADTSFSVGVLDDYDVQIRSNTPGGTIVAQSTAGSGNTDLTISSLDPGVFYVTATRASTECAAAPVKINILDERFLPELTLDSLIANINCGGGAANGQLMINADGYDHTNPDYTFQWYIGQVVGVVVPAGNGGTTANPFGLSEGFYTVEVTNTNTGCVRTQVFELPSIQILPTFTSYEVNNNTACVDNGSIVLLEGQYGSTLIDSMAMATNYTVGWYSDPGLTTSIVDPVPATPLELEQLGNGTYYVTLTNDTTNCTSEPLELVIIDNILYPSLNGLQIAADSTCNMTGTPTGALRVIADNQNNPGSNYTFTWYAASDLVTPISNNDTLSGQFAGDYVVEVTNTSIGCTSTETFTIQSRPVNIVINDVATTAPTSCMPPNGVIEVTDISYGVLSDYTFEFRDEFNNVVQSGTDSIFSAAEAGKYLIYATHNRLQCTNPLVYSVVVNDGNIIYPDIDLVSFENQTNCDPANPNGEITASADGSTDNVMYTFEWRDASNTVVEPNNATVTNIPAGTYTLNVTDNTTGCMSSASFDIIDDYPDPIRLVISTSPNTNCVNPNGEVSATIRNLAALGKPITDYQFYWFNGDQTSGVPDIANPDYSGTLISDLPDGDYTVYVVDAADAFCTSDPTLVTIQDRTLPPPFQIEIQNHVTICYDSLPDGRARINPNSLETNRELFEFTYEWFNGTAADTAGQTPFVTGIRADSLDIGTYSVLSTDLRTGCENLVTFDIIDDTDAVPAPDVNVVSNRDNCLFANGHAVATISGSITGYRFEWFLATGDTTTVQFTGHEIFTLDSVDYKVRATRLSTGCISPRTPVEIINAIENPVFEIATTTSLCLRTEDGAFNQFTGTAEVMFSQFGVIKQIDWIAPDGTIFSNDIKLVNAQPGRWEVRFVLDNDCEYFGTFGIETALKIYNGVSANADGLNDYFFIDCIDYFPSNNVQIFNRDGTKVWESDSYDNNEVRFDGYSNVGRGGLQLPAGTYFYIIEKGPQDWGTEDELVDNTIRPRIQGYLELVR